LTDAECVALLRWVLPRLGLRFEGFRRVRRSVCRRVARRIAALGLADAAAYTHFLETHAEEWARLDALCRVPISRFHRDWGVFEALRRVVLPSLAETARVRPERCLRCWSAGCASGEEPYTLAACLELEIVPRFPGLRFAIVASDVDDRLLARARSARYAASSIREVPPSWREALFESRDGLFEVRARFRRSVELRLEDLRREAPDGPFDLVLCRNAAFTYFSTPLQNDVLARIAARLRSGGALVLGRHESPPGAAARFVPWPGAQSTFRWLGSETRRAPV